MAAALQVVSHRGQFVYAPLSMLGKRVQRNSITYSAAISAWASGGQRQRALGLFETMLRERAQRDALTYNTAISACDKGGQWQQA